MFDQKNERGMASILITMIMMIVISLIVIGFAQVSNREQRDALDRQLSAEALYAAKSGINDAESIIIGDIQHNQTIVTATSCNPASNSVYEPSQSQMSLNKQVQYTCVLVNPTPTSLVYSPLSPGRGQTIPVFAQAPGNPNQASNIVISWQEYQQPNGTGDFSGCPNNAGQFPQPGWPGDKCTAGVLQVDMVPASGWSDDASLMQSEHTIFLEPTSSPGAGNVDVAASPQGATISGNCTATGTSGEAYECYATLTDLPMQNSTTGYYLHVLPYYETVNVAVTAYNSSASSPLQLYNAQAVIDSTGRASDEIKRIQDRVGINSVSANNLPPNALQSTNSICKQFEVRPGVVSGPGAPGIRC